VDGEIVDGLGARLQAGEWQPLDLPGQLIRIDTTDVDSLDLDPIASQASILVAGPEPWRPSPV
jgi:hypothetical protein